MPPSALFSERAPQISSSAAFFSALPFRRLFAAIQLLGLSLGSEKGNMSQSNSSCSGCFSDTVEPSSSFVCLPSAAAEYIYLKHHSGSAAFMKPRLHFVSPSDKQPAHRNTFTAGRFMEAGFIWSFYVFCCTKYHRITFVLLLPGRAST